MLSCNSKTHVVKKLAAESGATGLVTSLERYGDNDELIFNTNNLKAFAENDRQNILIARTLFRIQEGLKNLSAVVPAEMANALIEKGFSNKFMEFDDAPSIKGKFLSEVKKTRVLSGSLDIDSSNFDELMLEPSTSNRNRAWLSVLIDNGATVDWALLEPSDSYTDEWKNNAKFDAFKLQLNKLKKKIPTEKLISMVKSFQAKGYKTSLMLETAMNRQSISDFDLKENRIKMLSVLGSASDIRPCTFFNVDETMEAVGIEKMPKVFISQFFISENCIPQNIPSGEKFSVEQRTQLAQMYSFSNILTDEDFTKLGFESPYDNPRIQPIVREMMRFNVGKSPSEIGKMVINGVFDKINKDDSQSIPHTLLIKGGKPFFDALNQERGNENVSKFLNSKDVAGRSALTIFKANEKRKKLKAEMDSLFETLSSYVSINDDE